MELQYGKSRALFGPVIAFVSVLLFSASTAFAAPNCTLANIICIGASQEYNTTGVTNVEIIFQQAINAAKPGDTLKIRGGTYRHIAASSSTTTFWDVKVSGTSALPITIEPFDGESVIFEGFGFPEGTAGPSRTDERIIWVSGNYINLRNIEINKSSRYGLEITGSYGNYENLTVHDNWSDNVIVLGVDKDVKSNRLSYIESYRARHSGGITIVLSSSTPKTVSDTIIEYSISYNNGYQPDGNKVPEVASDPGGGSNSDGINTFKICHDKASLFAVDNLCPRTIIRNNITWHNADDGIDNSAGLGSVIKDNISFNNGPEGNKGFKGFSLAAGGLTYLGNVSISQPSFAFEALFTGEGYLYHNATANNQNLGIHMSVHEPIAGKARAINNLSVFNPGDTDYRFLTNSSTIAVEDLTNWAEQQKGDPGLPAVVNFTAATVVTTFPTGLTIAQKREFIAAQFRAAFTPPEGSPLIDAGTFITGIHCARADDDRNEPMDRNATCRHWAGNAPDIGVYEYAPLPAPPEAPVLSID